MENLEENAQRVYNALAAEIVVICRRHPNVAIRDIPEFKEVERIWVTMEVLEERFIKSQCGRVV